LMKLSPNDDRQEAAFCFAEKTRDVIVDLFCRLD